MKLLVENKDIISYVGDISLNSSGDTVGLTLTFKMTNNSDLYISPPQINLANSVCLLDDDSNVVFRGIIITKDTSKTQFSFNCYDFGFYLRQSKDIIQFNGSTATEAIRQLLNKYSVPIGSLPSLSILITKVYYDEYISDIIYDILDYCSALNGQKYFLEFSNGNFNIVGNVYVNPTIKISSNISGANINSYLNDTTKTETFENMKNKVVAYTEDSDNIQTIVTAQDSSNISKYGLLSEVLKIDADDTSRANYLATSKLNELNSISQTLNFSSLGSFDVLANRIIYINDSVTESVGNARVKDVMHVISNGIHKMQGEIELL